MGKDVEKHGQELDQFIADRLKYSELIHAHLVPCGSDLILLTLKGHLIIESLLEMNLCRILGLKCFPTNDQDKPNLEFHQKLRLVKSVVMKRVPSAKPNADLFCVVVVLNRVRNDLAHSLMDPKEIETSVKKVIDSYQAKADEKLDTGKPLADQLRACIVKICHFLDSVRVQSFKIDWYGED